MTDRRCGLSLSIPCVSVAVPTLPFSSRSAARHRPLKVMAWLLGGMLLLATLGLALGSLPEDDTVKIELVSD